MFITGKNEKSECFINGNANYEVQLFSTYLRMTVSKQNEVLSTEFSCAYMLDVTWLQMFII